MLPSIKKIILECSFFKEKLPLKEQPLRSGRSSYHVFHITSFYKIYNNNKLQKFQLFLRYFDAAAFSAYKNEVILALLAN